MMLSIKSRIIVLSLASLVFLLLAIFSEYSHIKQNVSDSKNSLITIEKISHISQLIHSLQKERGMSAIYFVKKGKSSYDSLVKQREITDSMLKNIAVSLASKNNLIKFIDELKKIRTFIDNNSVAWQLIKDFYAFEIDKLLTNISLNLIELYYQKEISHELYAVYYLLNARENLGILRADILHSYIKRELTQSEILEIGYKYSIFNNKFQYFKLHINKTPCDNIKKHLNDEFLKPLKFHITSTINKQKNLHKKSSQSWWKESTAAIDLMKKSEDTIFKNIIEYSQHNIQTQETNLFWYIAIAVILFVFISFLAISTVIHIFESVSIFTKYLSEVEKTEDFSLRVVPDSEDEFSQLNKSLNKFVNYTDTILEEKENLASIDLLTGVMNRRSFTSTAQREVEQSNRYERPLSLIFCDIDDFKQINDTYGHNIGDEVLKSFANVVSSNIRQGDYIVRWGGEEFMVLTPQTDETQASELAQNLRKLTSEIYIEEAKKFTCSFGVAQITKGESLEGLIKRADEAMYKAKELGKNQVVLASKLR